MFKPPTKDDLLAVLNTVRDTFNEVRAWEDNDGEPTVNSFANSGVGGDRSDALISPVHQAQHVASDVFRYTQNGEGRLDMRTKRWLESAGYPVVADQADYTAVLINPSEEMICQAEEAGEPTPEGMELILTYHNEDDD